MLFVGRQAVPESGRVDGACIRVDGEPVPVHFALADRKPPAEVPKHRRLEALGEPIGKIRRKVDDVLTVPRQRGEVGVRDHRTIGGRILHVQPVYPVGHVPVECEGHAGGALVGHRGDIETGKVRGHLRGERRYDAVIGLSVDEPAAVLPPDLLDGRARYDRGAPSRHLFLEPRDDLLESSLQVTQTLAPGAPVRPDSDTGYEPGCGDLARTVPKLAL